MIAAALFLIFSTKNEIGAYSTFEDARSNHTKVKIVGQLSKHKEMEYDPAKDPNYFSFYMTDANGEENKVVLLSEKPQDFELSEQIVATGKMNDNQFVASEILLKCPSKYKDEEIYIRSEKADG